MAVAPGKFFEVPIDLDGEQVPIRIARFDVDGNIAFRRDFARSERNRKREEMRLQRARLEGESDDAVIARLDLDDTAEVHQARARQEEEDEIFSKRFVVDTFERFVSVKPGALFDEDGTPIVDGAVFLERYAGRTDIVSSVMAQVFLQNVLPADLKKKLQLRSASATSSIASNAPSPTASGDTPAPTAAAVSNEASAGSAAATV